MTRLPQDTHKSYENAIVHPAVATWLTEQGYSWRYEYNTGDGFIDFLATHPEFGTLIVECKSDESSIQKTVMQVLYYSRLLNDQCSCAIAIPSHTSTKGVADKLERLGIMLITVDVINKKDFVPQRGADKAAIQELILWMSCESIQAFHNFNQTVATLDYTKLIVEFCRIYPTYAELIGERVVPYAIESSNREFNAMGSSWFETEDGKTLSVQLLVWGSI